MKIKKLIKRLEAIADKNPEQEIKIVVDKEGESFVSEFELEDAYLSREPDTKGTCVAIYIKHPYDKVFTKK